MFIEYVDRTKSWNSWQNTKVNIGAKQILRAEPYRESLKTGHFSMARDTLSSRTTEAIVLSGSGFLLFWLLPNSCFFFFSIKHCFYFIKQLLVDILISCIFRECRRNWCSYMWKYKCKIFFNQREHWLKSLKWAWIFGISFLRDFGQIPLPWFTIIFLLLKSRGFTNV